MLAAVTPESQNAPHLPVMLDEVCRALCPIRHSVVVDGTFGAGGYSRAFLKKQAGQVIAIDRDPTALAAARQAQQKQQARLTPPLNGDKGA